MLLNPEYTFADYLSGNTVTLWWVTRRVGSKIADFWAIFLKFA